MSESKKFTDENESKEDFEQLNFEQINYEKEDNFNDNSNSEISDNFSDKDINEEYNNLDKIDQYDIIIDKYDEPKSSEMNFADELIDDEYEEQIPDIIIKEEKKKPKPKKKLLKKTINPKKE